MLSVTLMNLKCKSLEHKLLPFYFSSPQKDSQTNMRGTGYICQIKPERHKMFQSCIKIFNLHIEIRYSQVLYTSLTLAKSFMSANKTVVFTTKRKKTEYNE